MQGCYIFVIFVCKRNVYDAILKKTGHYSVQSSNAKAVVFRKIPSHSGSGPENSGTRITRMQSKTPA